MKIRFDRSGSIRTHSASLPVALVDTADDLLWLALVAVTRNFGRHVVVMPVAMKRPIIIASREQW
jgi:hypothetical protein